LHFTTDQPFRTNRKDISHDQHPDHQLRIDRWTTHQRIMRCKFAAKPGQIESSVDLPHQMIFGDRVAKMKLVEQLTLVTLQTAHHGSTSPRIASHNGITLRGLSQPTFATKSANSGLMHRSKQRLYSITSSARVRRQLNSTPSLRTVSACARSPIIVANACSSASSPRASAGTSVNLSGPGVSRRLQTLQIGRKVRRC